MIMASLPRVSSDAIMPPVSVKADPDVELAAVVEATPTTKRDDPYLVEFTKPFDSDK